MGWANLQDTDKQKVIGLEVAMDNNPEFKAWMQEHWKALYEDIINESGLYPFWYNKIEAFYEEERQ